MEMILIAIFVFSALTIIVIVLLQEGKTGGLSGLTSENTGSYWAKNKKNTLEGRFERWTKIIAGLFMISALLLGVI
ncbi:preprotein translocase subunit SecG [Candidatus Epulonipiscium fishelsonii]|uniref:Preprotein translocase subunit SecG n=1 Tax=Candidatus Epulonipiscium fishelsonii TaxID=77094 RepID=A0ACC8XH66_9FIRM|nr:preprotein translocase subunit SecG [Epulopiscium sp. SCG-D08WGA-EpuloA1]OON94870.1 MAG: preprotein translocase subunit SecG [Epulopiscium sp. AS2M-Bin002]